MTTRNEIIAQIDNEISRLERARDFLAAALAGSNNDAKAASAIALARRAKKRAPTQSRPRAAITAPPPAAAKRGTADTACSSEAPDGTATPANGETWQVWSCLERVSAERPRRS